MNKIKTGIIGTGFISLAHIEAIRRLGFVEIIGIAASNQEKANKLSEQLGISYAYGDYKDLLKNEEIQVVHNCTPNNIHFEINKEIILSGKHILSEKPLTLNKEEAFELVKLTKEKNVVHAVNYNYRQYPIIQHLKASISKDELGSIHLVHGSYLQDWLLYQNDYNWRVHPEIGGSLRAIGDIGSHWIDLIQYILNQKVISVFADTTTLFETRKRSTETVETFKKTSNGNYEDIPIETEDFGIIMMKFENGTKGVVTVSQVSAGRKNRLSFEINGTKSSAFWNQEEPEKLWLGYRNQPNQLLLADPSLLNEEAQSHIHYPGGHNEAWADGLKNMMKQFYEFILENKTLSIDKANFPTFDEGYYCMCILDAIFESNKQGKWININEVNEL